MKICLSEEMADRIAARVLDVVPTAEILRLRPDGSFDNESPGVQVLCFSVDLSDSRAALDQTMLLLRESSLEWVQAPGAGVELPIWSELVERGVRLTTAAGVHAEPVAQYVFTQVLHWHRQVARHQQMQAERRWEPVVSDDLTTKTLGVIGFGGIGRAVARIGKAFGMSVVGLRRTPTDEPDADLLVGSDQLHELLGASDFVVLCAPLTEQTRHLIGSAELAAMRPGAVLINVARGGVVDHDALIEALELGTIAGASLDVTDPEPLPASSRLWSLTNCVITPHDAGYSPLAGTRLGELFLQNLAAFAAGAAMRNEVTHPVD